MTSLVSSRRFRLIERFLVCGTLAGYAACVLLVAGWLRAVDHPAIRYAVAFLFVQIAIQAGLILGLVASKHWRSCRERARAARRRRLEELLARPDSPREVLEMAARWPEDFLPVVENAIEGLAGSARVRVAELLEASAPYQQLLLEAADPDPGLVIRAISILGRMENTEARAAVWRGLKHPADAVRRAARRAIVTGDEDARRQVLDGLCSLPFWERIILLQLAPADSTFDDYLAKALASVDDERILVALEFVLTRQRLLLVPVPAGLAQSRNVEVRIKFFRALPFLPLEAGIYWSSRPGCTTPPGGSGPWRRGRADPCGPKLWPGGSRRCAPRLKIRRRPDTRRARSRPWAAKGGSASRNWSLRALERGIGLPPKRWRGA